MIPKTRKEAFKVLGLSENAGEKEIKKAYRKLILKWHPDKWSDESQEKKDKATEKYKEITVAYGILTGEIKEEFIRQQPNDDWANRWYESCKKCYGSHLSKEECNLFRALYRQDLTKTKTLLEQARNINTQTKFRDILTSKSILHYIVKNACNDPKSGWIELLEEVLSKYSANNSTPAIDVNIMSELYGTPLTIACQLGNLDVVNVLLKHGADPNVYSTYPPLYYALKENKIDIAKVLLEHGAKTEELDYRGFSKSTVEVLLPYASDRQKILHCIVENSCNDPDWIELLEEVLSKYGANNSTPAIDVNIMSELHGTPLCVACKLGSLDVVNVLLKHGAGPNVYNIYPPLHYALKENKIDIAKVLLEHGAKAEKLNPIIIVKYNKSAVEVLLPHLSDATKGMMLHHIATDDSTETDYGIEIVRLLLNSGADPDRFVRHADPKKKGELVKLCNEYKENAINNNLHPKKQPLGRRWPIIVPALLFGIIDATLAAIGVIPEIVAIGAIATVVLSGIVGALVGGVVGYLVDIAINRCCGNQQCAA